MATKHTNIRLRRGTAAEWQAVNELLLLGEPGYEKDTGKLKIGDGVTLWNSLPYFNDGNPINLEELQDILGDSGFLVAGNNIDIIYNDNDDKLTVKTVQDPIFNTVTVGGSKILGDGTLELVPNNDLYNNDQYLVVDPTAPNHIHLRAGGTTDDSNAQLIVGGENSNLSVSAGDNPNITITAQNNTWVFTSNNQTYYVMANADGNTVTSTDGLNWSGPFDLNMNVNHIATNGETIVAISSSTIGYTSFSSPSSATSVSVSIPGISDINFNQILYGGGYFVVCGSGNDGSKPVPMYGYSFNGYTWTFKVVEGELATTLANNSDEPCVFSDVDYNGTGWNFAVNASNVGGGVYTINMDETLTNANYFGMVPGYQVAWNGNAWYYINSNEGSGFNINSDPRTGTWVGPYDPSSSSQQDLGIALSISDVSDTFSGGNGHLVLSDNNGHISYSSDNGESWSHITPIPYSASITNITYIDNKYQLTITGTYTSHADGEKIIISGSSVAGYNGTYFLDDENFLYTDYSLTTAWDPGAIDPFSGTATLTWSHGTYIDAMDYVNGYFYIGNDDEQIARSSDLINWTIVDDRNNAFDYWNDFNGYSTQYGNIAQFITPNGGTLGSLGMGWPGFYNSNVNLPVSVTSRDINSGSPFASMTVYEDDNDSGSLNISVAATGFSEYHNWYFNKDGELKLSNGGLRFDDNSIQTTAAINVVNDAFNTSVLAGDGIDLIYDGNNDTLTISTLAKIDLTGIDDNEFLVYNGTTKAFEPSNNLTFDGLRMTINCDCPAGTAGFTAIGDNNKPTLIRQNSWSDPYPLPGGDDDALTRATNRYIFFSGRGTDDNRAPLEVGDTIFIMRGDGYNPHGTLSSLGTIDNRTMRISCSVAASGTHYLGSDLLINTSSGGPTLYDNSFRFTYDGRLLINNIDITSGSLANLETMEPDGFINRTDSVISFNNSLRKFIIQPSSPGGQYIIYNDGVRIVKNSTEELEIPASTNLYFIFFDKSTNALGYSTTYNTSTQIPIAQVYWNNTDNKVVYFGEERHGIRMDNATHKYLHNVMGTQYISGLSISNYSLSGNGSTDSDATISISNGIIYDEDIEANITNSATPSNPFEQILDPVAQIPVYYRSGDPGIWTDTSANNFPLKVGTTAQYNLDTGGLWTVEDSPNPTNDRYVASWICATTQENAPIIAIMGQRIDSSIEQAKSNNSWGNLSLSGLPIAELRPLYRLIYDTKSTFSNGAKAFLADILDIRSHVDTVTGLIQNDHGNLYGLADDDHQHYVHIDNARTISAVHTFSNGLNAGNLSIDSANTISSTNTDGNINISPDGDGSIVGGSTNSVASVVSTVISGGTNNSIEDGGDYSAIGGGESNAIKEGSSSNDAPSYSVIGGGYSNEITSTSYSVGDYSVIGGGNDNRIYETNNSVIGGGANNDIGDAGNYSTIGGGSYNAVRTGYYTTIPGGYEATTKDRAELAYANGKFSSIGDAQYSMYILKNTTSNSGWNSLVLDYPTNSDDTITIDSTTATFTINISGRNSVTGDSIGFIVRGCVKKISSTVSLVGSPVIESFADTNFSSANVQILTSGSGLIVQVDQGSYSFSGTNYWVANVQMSRVTI